MATSPYPPIGQAILEYIDLTKGPWAWEGEGMDPFNALALGLFVHQFEHNLPYRHYCEGLGVAPGRISAWQEIPPVATDAFKVVSLTTLAEGARPEGVFRTSGTTQGEQGIHSLATLDYYHRALLPAFKRHLCPDRPAMRILDLTPSGEDSSLGHMARYLGEALGTPESTRRMGEGGLDLEGAWRDLEACVEAGEPILILGTAFSFVFLLEQRPAFSLNLPAGSRLMETGGFKGRTRAIPRSQLRLNLRGALGLAPGMIVGEYGMTELSSQLYGTSLRAALLKEPVVEGYVSPPWMKLRVVDPISLEERPQGEEGLIAFLDLANVESVAAILTGDLGRITPEGRLSLLGRAKGADARGCSLRVEEMMSAQGGGGGP